MKQQLNFIHPRVLYNIGIEYRDRTIGIRMDVDDAPYFYTTRDFARNHLMLKDGGWGIDAQALQLLRPDITEVHVQVIKNQVPSAYVYTLDVVRVMAHEPRNETQGLQYFVPLHEWQQEVRQYVVPRFSNFTRKTTNWHRIIEIDRKTKAIKYRPA